jgi:hypothetical protein
VDAEEYEDDMNRHDNNSGFPDWATKRTEQLTVPRAARADDGRISGRGFCQESLKPRLHLVERFHWTVRPLFDQIFVIGEINTVFTIISRSL